MLKIYKYIPIILGACAVLFSGCGRDDTVENLKVPRLMLEVRGVNYGEMNTRAVVLPMSGTKIYLRKEPLVNEFEIVNVELVQVELGLALMVQLSEKGARELYRSSVTNNGGIVVLTVNGTAIGARRLDGAITDGKYYTFVELPNEELPDLVLDMKDSIAAIQAKK